MGDQAPPNFNPSVSLLSGGESVPITAVQGGGGLDDVSMLSGGEGAIIQPVRGGAGILKRASQAIKKRLGFKNNSGDVEANRDKEKKNEDNDNNDNNDDNINDNNSNHSDNNTNNSINTNNIIFNENTRRKILTKY